MSERASLLVDTFADERERARPPTPGCRAPGKFLTVAVRSVLPKWEAGIRNEHKTPARRFSAGK